MIKLLSMAVPPGGCMLDVGANIGFYTIGLGRMLKPHGGRVFAIEPVRSNYDRLVENIRLNNLEEAVTTLNYALGNEQGSILIQMETDNQASTGNAALVVDGASDRDAQTNGVSRVPLMRLDDIAGAQNIHRLDLIKVDIEGAELQFLHGSEKMIQQHLPVIYSEVNPHRMNLFGYGFKDLRALLEGWEYSLYKQTGKCHFAPLHPQEDITGHLTNVLAVPRTASDSLRATLSLPPLLAE